MHSKNPYLSIWFNTKTTIDQVISKQVRFEFYIPILLTVLSVSLRTFEEIFKLDFLNSKLFLSFLLVAVTIIIGYLFLGVIFPWLILKTGKIWNGQSNFRELQLIVGLSQIPVMLILLEQLIFLSFGELLYDTQANMVIQLIVRVFYMRILIIGVAKIQGFNYGIAFLNLVITALPFFIIQVSFR